MDIPLSPSPDDLKMLGARDGRNVRERLDAMLSDLDIKLYRAMVDAPQPLDLYQMQGAAKVVQKLRQVLSKAPPAQF